MYRRSIIVYHTTRCNFQKTVALIRGKIRCPVLLLAPRTRPGRAGFRMLVGGCFSSKMPRPALAPIQPRDSFSGLKRPELDVDYLRVASRLRKSRALPLLPLHASWRENGQLFFFNFLQLKVICRYSVNRTPISGLCNSALCVVFCLHRSF
jgi:hypothetical protein